MLSLYTLKSASDASRYYQQGDYYTQESTHAYSEWFGKGADIFDLKGKVDFEIFKSLLSGHLPSGEVMTQVKKGGHHRPGYDLTFSAPKSVSLLALVMGEKAILEAHRQAVKETLTRLEQNYAGCRRKHNGMTEIERTHNLTAAIFEHVDSRAGDAQLHSHCVLMNCTQREDEAWRTLYADELYRNKLFIGLLYRSSLAHQLLSLGYELELKEKGLFEIKGAPPELMEFSSKRRGQIKDWLIEQNGKGGKMATLANFLTRKPKVSANPQERRARWLEEARVLGGLEVLQSLIEQAKERGPVLPPNPKDLADQAVHSAIQHLSEWQSHFSLPELIKTAERHSLLEINQGEILGAVEGAIQNKALVYLQDKTLTTPQAQDLTQANIQQLKQGKGSLKAISLAWIAKFTTGLKTSDVREQVALTRLLTSKDRQVLLQSPSQLLLDDALKQFIPLVQSYQCYPRVLVQTQLEVDSLKNTFGRINTLEGFLLSCEHRISKKTEPQYALAKIDRRLKNWAAQDVWIVRGSLSSQQFNRLSVCAEKLAARIIFAQSKPCVALDSLKDQGLTQIRLRSSQNRLENLSVKARLLGQINQLEQKNALITAPIDAFYQQAFQSYLELPAALKTLVCLKPSDKLRLNQQFREQLTLTSQTQSFNILRPLYFTNAEKTQVFLYQLNDILRFKDHYYEVTKIDLVQGLLILRREQQDIDWNPLESQVSLKDIEVFKPERRDVQEGDTLRWTRGLKEETQSRIKGQALVVTKLSLDEITVQSLSGLEFKLNPKDFKDQHWEYGYVISLKEFEQQPQAAVILIKEPELNAKTLDSLSTVLSLAQRDKQPIRLLCRDPQTLKQAIDRADSGKTPSILESLYQREQALSSHQTLATQPLFNGLQSAFLNIHQRNPEFQGDPQKSLPWWFKPTPHARTAVEVVDKVCLYHSERNAVVSLETLKQDSLRFGAFLAPIEDLEKAVKLVIHQDWMSWVGNDALGQPLFAAKHTLLIENLCIQKMKIGQNQLAPILDKTSPQLQEALKNERLTQGQKEAIELILTTPDRMVAVQGVAGSGKTTALKEIHRLCEANHYSLVLANTASAKNQAKTASNMEAQTIAQFLTRVEPRIEQDLDQAKRLFGGKRLHLVDESSLVASLDLLKLQIAIEKLEARVVFIGDFKQLNSIGSGLSLHDLLVYGIRRVVMRENVRLTDRTAFTAMKQAYAGDVRASLTTLKDTIEEIPDKQEALQTLASLYVCFSLDKEPPLLVTPLNEDRRLVNELVRTQLKQAGRLEKEGVSLEIFVPKDRREMEKKEVASYQVQDWIRFNSNHSRLGIKSGDYAQVVEVDLKHQRLTLQIENQPLIYWSPKDLKKPSQIELYGRETRELSIQEKIIFKRNHEALGVCNGDSATVLKIENGIAEVLSAEGSRLSLDLNQKQNQHLDYGYALTTLAVQGKDVPLVMAYLEGPKPVSTTTQELKRNDVVILSKERQKEEDNETSKVVQLIKIQGLSLTFKDRRGKIWEVSPKPNESWQIFPPFEERNIKHLPLSTSQQSLLIQITRGNQIILVTPYLDYLQQTLERHEQIKRSALSYQDKNWPELHNSVKRLVEDIKGLVEPLPPPTVQKTPKSSVQKNQKPTAEKIRIEALKPYKSYAFERPNTFIDKDSVNYRLNQDVLGYASQWLGPPKKKSGREARWPGALTVTLTGSQAGRWKRWSGGSGEGGRDLISLYAYVNGLEWKAAIQELGLNLGINPIESPHKVFVPEKSNSQSEDSDVSKKIENAKRLYNKGTAIQGTLAEKYLRDHRGIRGELPKEFRFFNRAFHFETQDWVPALLAPIKNKEGKFIGVHKIFLNLDGSKYDKRVITQNGVSEKAIAKISSGSAGGGAVTVHQGVVPGTVLLAEGIETALSVVEAQQNYTVMASLSVNQLKNVPLSPDVQKIVICADKDEAGSSSSKTVIEAIAYHLGQGRQVFLALPSGSGKRDFNDLLKDKGVAGVQQSLEGMVEIKDARLLREQGGLEQIARAAIKNLDDKLLKGGFKDLGIQINEEKLVQRGSIKEIER